MGEIHSRLIPHDAPTAFFDLLLMIFFGAQHSTTSPAVSFRGLGAGQYHFPSPAIAMYCTLPKRLGSLHSQRLQIRQDEVLGEDEKRVSRGSGACWYPRDIRSPIRC